MSVIYHVECNIRKRCYLSVIHASALTQVVDGEGPITFLADIPFPIPCMSPCIFLGVVNVNTGAPVWDRVFPAGVRSLPRCSRGCPLPSVHAGWSLSPPLV